MIADPFTWLFAQIVRARNVRYDDGRLPVDRLRLPVISRGQSEHGREREDSVCADFGALARGEGDSLRHSFAGLRAEHAVECCRAGPGGRCRDLRR